MKISLLWVFLSTILLTNLAQADESYYYVEASMGHWFNGEYSGGEQDGEIPATVALGRAWERGQWEVSIEARHRSNLDLGWPFNNKPEYSRNGLFTKLQYRWK